jgi:hypothetical protein
MIKRTTLATETHLAGGQFLLEEQMLNKEKSPETCSFQTRTEFRTKVNLNTNSASPLPV